MTLKQNEVLEEALGLSSEEIGKLWDQGIQSGECIPLTKIERKNSFKD